MKAATCLVGLALVVMRALSQAPPRVPKPSMIKSETPGHCAPGSSIGVDMRQEYLEFRLSDMFFGTRGHSRTDESAICDMDVEFVSWFYKWRVAISDVTYSGRLNLTNGVQLYVLSSKADFRYIHLENSVRCQGATPFLGPSAPPVWLRFVYI
ncbi:hypothetical protein DL770_009954 [Monosporascus sp. CRB-9-2]|nr:hypothetical protein DL770_009954 [Monosporascus sp. CRB-9-2]